MERPRPPKRVIVRLGIDGPPRRVTVCSGSPASGATSATIRATANANPALQRTAGPSAQAHCGGSRQGSRDEEGASAQTPTNPSDLGTRYSRYHRGDRLRDAICD
jgi:hypothetical protein